eukprot:scaffold22577_cov122-Cylindrotheca_fusiformis.AAC.33
MRPAEGYLWDGILWPMLHPLLPALFTSQDVYDGPGKINLLSPEDFATRAILSPLNRTVSIEKSQGQSLTRVGLALQTQCVAHGQLYTAISRPQNVNYLPVLNVVFNYPFRTFLTKNCKTLTEGGEGIPCAGQTVFQSAVNSLPSTSPQNQKSDGQSHFILTKRTNTSMIHFSSAFVILTAIATLVTSFSPCLQSRENIQLFSEARSDGSRSRVADPFGPTPALEDDEIETIDVDDIPELRYDPDNHPIPHQPWRRGETAGCEDPIDAKWRQQAEKLMRKAVEMLGGEVIDVTWFLTCVVVTINEDLSGVHKDLLKTSGPVINVVEPQPPMYRDPADPNPEAIWADTDEDNIRYEKDEETESDVKSKMYARQEDGEESLELDEQDDIPMYSSQESREDEALRVAEEAELREERRERSVSLEALKIDTVALSLIAGAITDSLETVEEELRVLARHEIVLTSPGAPDVLETQNQFDSHRGSDVAVETQDPWQSNRTLRGKLLDRNSMDVLINQNGRMVTVPLNFVKCVRLQHTKVSNNATKDPATTEG